MDAVPPYMHLMIVITNQFSENYSLDTTHVNQMWYYFFHIKIETDSKKATKVVDISIELQLCFHLAH